MRWDDQKPFPANSGEGLLKNTGEGIKGAAAGTLGMFGELENALMWAIHGGEFGEETEYTPGALQGTEDGYERIDNETYTRSSFFPDVKDAGEMLGADMDSEAFQFGSMFGITPPLLKILKLAKGNRAGDAFDRSLKDKEVGEMFFSDPSNNELTEAILQATQ